MNTDLPKLLKQIRLNHSLTQSDIAESLNVTPGYISNVENGRTALSLKMLIWYAGVCGVSLEEMVKGEVSLEKQGDVDEDRTQRSSGVEAVEEELMVEIGKLDVVEKRKLLKIIRVLNE